MIKIFISFVLCLFIACGNVDAQQVGVGQGNNIITHGHSNINDGGILGINGATIYHNTTQVVNNLATIDVAFNSEILDTYGVHNNVTNNHLVTVPLNAGFVLMQCSTYATRGTSGLISLLYSIMKNGSAFTPEHTALTSITGTYTMIHMPAAFYPVSAGDTLSWSITNNSGVAVTLGASSTSRCWFIFYK